MTPSPQILPLVLPLASAAALPNTLGGKGAALARLYQAGFPVPRGFCVATGAYRAFTAAHGIGRLIQQRLQHLEEYDPAHLQEAAAAIQAQFLEHELPAELSAALGTANAGLGGSALAVRSSATAEDLPNLSFAGQHDSFLNVEGSNALEQAIRRCWASLWNAHAISYRQQAGIDQTQVAMAVVVQKMVRADTAGVLFTRDPVNGENRMIVNATPDLADELVAGKTAAEQYTLSPAGQPLRREPQGAALLTDEQLHQLAALGRQVEDLFDTAGQDIEWAMADGKLWLLQARPITTISDGGALSWAAPYPGARLLRRQIVENMPAPLSPLFETLYLHRALDTAMDNLLRDMALPVDVDAFISRPLFTTVNGYGYCRYEFNSSWRLLSQVPRVLWWYVRVLPGWLKRIVPDWESKGLPAYLTCIETWRSRSPPSLPTDDLYRGIQQLAQADADYWYQITLVMGAAKLSEDLLARFLGARSTQRRPAALTASELLRGFDSPTLAAQQALAAIAADLQTQPALLKTVTASSAGELVQKLAALEADPDAAALLDRLRAHIDHHGHQVYNLDFAEPTQAERPAPILLALQTLAAQRDPAARLERRREQMRELSRRQRDRLRIYLGPLQRRVFDRLLAWAERYAPYREQALHYMGAAWPVLRQLAGELGARMTAAGVIARADDIYYLRHDEIACWLRTGKAPGDTADLRAAVTARRLQQRQRRRLHPPGRVPTDLRFRFGPFDFTRLFEGWETQKRNAPRHHVLAGFAVSPGRVSGIASVVLDPADLTQMQPDTILVCPTTTPAWTPLFSRALALVTDIGAPLAHGSIVAREFGIPAVLGTGNATRLIHSGQRITVDGDQGVVDISAGAVS